MRLTLFLDGAVRPLWKTELATGSLDGSRADAKLRGSLLQRQVVKFFECLAVEDDGFVGGVRSSSLLSGVERDDVFFKG